VKICKPEYLKKALLLSSEDQERVLSRMSGKLPRRLHKDRLSVDEALAIQLEIEDEQLNEWRAKMHALKASTATSAKPKKASKTKIEDVASQSLPAEPEKKKTTQPVKKSTPKASTATASQSATKSVKQPAPSKSKKQTPPAN
jgi:hypothetical protein